MIWQKQHTYRIHQTVQLYLVCIVHRHANATAVFECEHLHSVFFATGRSEHQLEFPRLFNNVVGSLVLQTKADSKLLTEMQILTN